jgi:hypothetical protein
MIAEQAAAIAKQEIIIEHNKESLSKLKGNLANAIKEKDVAQDEHALMKKTLIEAEKLATISVDRLMEISELKRKLQSQQEQQSKLENENQALRQAYSETKSYKKSYNDLYSNYEALYSRYELLQKRSRHVGFGSTYSGVR